MRWLWSSPTSRRSGRSGTPLPHPWWRRNWPVLAVVLAIILGVGLWKCGPWNPCGPGLSSDGSACIGLDLDGSGFGGNDKLGSLEKIISHDNKVVTGSGFVTIVYLDDMEPDPAHDSVNPAVLRHRVEGLIAGQLQANTPEPKVRVLLANYGGQADDWKKAVTAIEQNASGQHIVAVTGIGQSLGNTKDAIDDLSAHKIITVGSAISGDVMNQSSKPDSTQYFYRVTPTNKDMAKATASYIGKTYNKIIVVQDSDSSDQYTSNLAEDFEAAERRNGNTISQVESYVSAPGPSTGPTRNQIMTGHFQSIRPYICSYRPDLIYFAGRGADLYPFLTALGEGGSCGLSHVDIISGEDLNTAAGVRWQPLNGITVHVFYTTFATRDEWDNAVKEHDIGTSDSDYITGASDYRTFTQSFHFPAGDLADGHAIMEYDAMRTVTSALQRDQSAAGSPGLLPGDFQNFKCDQGRWAPGAGGQIAFYRDDQSVVGGISNRGNPIDKPVPIMELNSKGDVNQVAMEWSSGQPFDRYACGQGSS